jgi:hypothetical protein
MDKHTLKQALEPVFASFEADGTPIELAGIMPTYPDVQTETYILQVYSSWLNQIPGCAEPIRIVVEKLFALLTPDILYHIDRVEICDDKGDVHCTSDAIIVGLEGYTYIPMPCPTY